MAPNQDRAETLVPEENPSVGARVSVRTKAALKQYINYLNQQRSAAEGIYPESEFVRQAVIDRFRKLEKEGELPGEVSDLLDDDSEADGGTKEAANA